MSGKGLRVYTSGVALGDLARDRISGLEGIVTGRAEYLYGCVQVLLIPRGVKDGAPLPGVWLDEDRVEAIEAGAVKRPCSADERRGGPVCSSPECSSPLVAQRDTPPLPAVSQAG